MSNPRSGEEHAEKTLTDRLNAGDLPEEAGTNTASEDPDTGQDPTRERSENASGLRGRLQYYLNLPNSDTRKILFVALVLCLVCSVLVSTAAVALRPLQARNAEADRRSNILAVAGLLQPGVDVNSVFSSFDRRMVDLDTGEFTDAVASDTYDAQAAAQDPATSEALPPNEDIAGIGRRARYAEVYLLEAGDGQIEQIILPVYGKGLWSTLYGYLSIAGDLRTIDGLQFYQHAETPGLGGEVDNPAWRAQWRGKLAYDDNGQVAIEVIKGKVNPSSPDAEYEVDGLAGATLTSRGVNNLIRFWLGDRGFGPLLKNLDTEGVS